MGSEEQQRDVVSKFLGRRIRWDNKMYRVVPWIPNEDLNCIGCAFSVFGMESGCSSHKLRKENGGDCPDDIVFIRATKEGMAEYIARRLE